MFVIVEDKSLHNLSLGKQHDRMSVVESKAYFKYIYTIYMKYSILSFDMTSLKLMYECVATMLAVS